MDAEENNFRWLVPDDNPGAAHADRDQEHAKAIDVLRKAPNWLLFTTVEGEEGLVLCNAGFFMTPAETILTLLHTRRYLDKIITKTLAMAAEATRELGGD